MKKRKLDYLFDYISILLLLISTIFLVVQWEKIPETIPIHYNLAGEVDGYGGKGILIFLAFAEWGVFLLFYIIGKFPSIWDTGVERTPANEEKINGIIKTMLGILQTAIVMNFSYIFFCIAFQRNTGMWNVLLFAGVIFGTIIVTVVRLIRNQ